MGFHGRFKHHIVVKRNVGVPMPDGALLLADHYYPRGGGKPPTILVRTPYGRSGRWGNTYGRPFAERGFQVLIQSCRGTFGSGGEFYPYRNERADGLATLEWIKRQGWFSGQMATVGPSYFGFNQWAIAADAGPELRAVAPQVTSSEFRSMVYPGESFWLDVGLTWVYQMSHQEDSPLPGLLARGWASSKLVAAFNHLPLCGADEVAVGKPVPYFRDWLEHNEPEDGWWKPVDFSADVSKVTAPAHLLGGWYDILLPQTIADYTRLNRAGRQPYLTIGPWAHSDDSLIRVAVTESIAWCRAHLMGDRSELREAPVRVFVMGAGMWRDFREWPPVGIRTELWHLHPCGGLSPANPIASEPDQFRYDPADPTPAVGGSSFGGNSGPKDNRALEKRPDVLVYSGPPLERDMEVIGPIRAELYVSSSLEHTDFFARLCDVEPSGKSINVCDGILRVIPGRPMREADGCLKVELDLWPTAYCFHRSHRIRLQVSSGAHPRFARNLGGGERLSTATKLVTADQTVFHDPAHPSAVLLPVIG